MSTLSNLSNALSNASTTASSALSSLGTSTASNSSSTSSSSSSAMQSIAGNFDTFLQLLTTQLQNQDPLDPLDTDSFTQELVEFASVEQQVDMNTNLQTMISMQQTSEATSALQLVGSTVTVSGSSAALSTGHITITSSVGTTAYTGTVALNSGTQSYSWNGVGNNGQTWPDGTYTIAISATGASGQSVSVSTQMQGTVSGVNLSSNPPTLTVNGQNVQISQVTSITK
jgi:flagellar basal-body rod modification protein FlgD